MRVEYHYSNGSMEWVHMSLQNAFKSLKHVSEEQDYKYTGCIRVNIMDERTILMYWAK